MQLFVVLRCGLQHGELLAVQSVDKSHWLANSAKLSANHGRGVLRSQPITVICQKQEQFLQNVYSDHIKGILYLRQNSSQYKLIIYSILLHWFLCEPLAPLGPFSSCAQKIKIVPKYFLTCSFSPDCSPNTS